MKYTEEEKETIENAKNNILRGNDIESAALILEKLILDGVIIVGGRINILKVAAKQIINFIEEYKNKEYLDVVREKVYANEESRRKDEIIEKQQKEIERLENIKTICPVTNTSGIRCDLKEKGINYIGADYSLVDYIPKEAIREKIEECRTKRN